MSGTHVTLVAAPNEGYRFDKWEVVSGGVSLSGSTFTIGTANVEIKAHFTKIPEPDPEPEIYTVKVSDDGNGQGAATPSSGVSGTQVTLVAAPNEGYKFLKWEVLSGGVEISGNKFTIGTANVEVKACFEKIPEADPVPDVYPVKVTTDGNGVGAADPVSGPEGTVVTLTAAPFEGYRFLKWEVLSGGVEISENKVSIGKSAVEIKAVFETVEAPAPEPSPEPEPEPIYISGVKISDIKDQTFTGKAIKPKVTVTFKDQVLTEGTDYTLSYQKNKAIGTATVTVTGTGKYTGTAVTTFTIIPKPVKGLSLKAEKTDLTVKWKKAAVTGYEIQYSLKKNFKGAETVTIKKAKITKTVIKDLKLKKTYYIRIRAYKTVKGKLYYSEWSKPKTITIK